MRWTVVPAPPIGEHGAMSQGIESAVRDSARRQVTMHRVSGGVWALLGTLFFVLSIFVTGKADEQGVRVVAGTVGAVLMVAGGAYIHVMTGRVATLVELLLSRRGELKGPEIIALRMRGSIFAYEIRVRDSSSRQYRMRVASEAAAREMMANIPPLGA